jgi:hypothetical protein
VRNSAKTPGESNHVTSSIRAVERLDRRGKAGITAREPNPSISLPAFLGHRYVP